MTTLHRYVIGFALSFIFTGASVGALLIHNIHNHAAPSHEALAVLFVLFALLQLMAQLYFFMHLGSNKKMRSNTALFGLTAIIIVIVVGGTLWIMSNLNSQHPSLQEFADGVATPENQIQ